MSFPQLNDWKNTSWSLHQASMLLGPIHNAVFAPQNNYLHLPMFIEPSGLVSQKLPQGGYIHVNFKDAAVIYERSNGARDHFPFADHTQASLLEALLTSLKQEELASFFDSLESETLAAGLMQKLHADGTRVEFLKLEDVTNTEPLTCDQKTARDYADVLSGAFTAVARFRGHLNGHMTPIVVWPEHFDLSTLWFHPDNHAMEDGKPHLNFGFTPYTPGQYEFPYLYAYAYPYPEPFDPPVLPEPAFWNTEGWRGVVVKYEDLQIQTDPVDFIEALLREIQEILYTLIR